MSSPQYTELRVKSAFSFQHGASQPDELLGAARELGLSGLAITDINTLAGVVRAYRAARELDFPLIVGAEIQARSGAPVLFLAKNRRAYGNLSRLISLGRRRAPKGECWLEWSDILDSAEDQILVTWPEREDDPRIEELADVAQDGLYIGLERRLQADDPQRARLAMSLARRLGRQLVATNDVRYHSRQRQPLHDIMSCLRHHQPLHSIGRRLAPSAERCLKSPAQMAALFQSIDPGALSRTLEIQERCRFRLDELRYEYPKELSPSGETIQQTLRRLTEAGARERYPDGVPSQVRGVIEKELALIAELQFEAYFLTVEDIVRFARRRGILCQGRGSAANSAVCYCLGITEVDPARHELLFERFISAERGEPPDIDVDFEHERREEVIQFIYEKYGRERAGMTAALIRYRERSALRDVGRAMGLSTDALDRLSGAASWRGEGPDPEDLKRAGIRDGAASQKLLGLAAELYGFPRHLSQHVGGLIITAGRLDELVPIENAAMDGRTVIEWDKDDIDALGILKIDVLALGILSALRKTFALISEPIGPGAPALCELEGREALAAILREDQGGSGQGPQARAVYEMLCRADSVGVFQVESRAQMAMLPRLAPRAFYDLVIQVAIVRPGPIQGDMVNPYLARRHGAKWSYPHPCTAPVLERTLGVPLFQEQVMQLAMVAADFTASEADGLRRAMGAWRKPGVMENYRRRLMEGFTRKGLSRRFAEQVYQQIEGFGSYGFPESHAASFALLAYVSAWLKRFHPAAFTAALINSQPMGFYTPAQLIRDAREHGVEIEAIDINASDWDCSLEANPRAERRAPQSGARVALPPSRWGAYGPKLRLGFRLIRGISKDEIEALIGARLCGGPFRSFTELRRRTGLRRAALERLARADALRSIGLSRRQALWRGLANEDDRPLFPSLVPDRDGRLPLATEAEEIFADMRATGLSLRRHPMALLRLTLRELGAETASRLKEAQNGEALTVAGAVTLRQKPETAKGVLFLSLEDETGSMSLIVPPPIVKRYRVIARSAPLLLAHGRVERAGLVVHLIVRRLEELPTSLLPLQLPSRNFR